MNGLLRFLVVSGCTCAVAALAITSVDAAAKVAAADPAGDTDNVKAGVEAWSAGQYEAAVQLWKPLADKGDADAQFNLAQAYKLGRGVPLDLEKAESLYGKAAAHGHVQAADNYGLLLFQRGQRDAAQPYITAAASRGDARAQYILGIAYFNGDLVEKDWVRAYALVSLAQQAGLPQATRALAQMDEHIPIEQRQQSVTLAAKLSADAEAARARLDASATLGTSRLAETPAPAHPPIPRTAPTSGPEVVPLTGPATAGADYARPQVPATPLTTRPVPKPPVPAATPPKPTAKPSAPKPSAPNTDQGTWRLQLGAFGVPGNAERLWSALSKRPELAGKRRELVPGGSLTRLYAAGFATKPEADKACAALKSPSQPCLVAPA